MIRDFTPRALEHAEELERQARARDAEACLLAGLAALTGGLAAEAELLARLAGELVEAEPAAAA